MRVALPQKNLKLVTQTIIERLSAITNVLRFFYQTFYDLDSGRTLTARFAQVYLSSI